MTETVAPTDEIRDFTKSIEPLKFRIGSDIFEATPLIPARQMLSLATTLEKFDERNPDMGLFETLFNTVLRPGSRDRFIRRMDDSENPIDFEQVNQVIQWLMEQYGLRPIAPPPNSSDGSANRDGGNNSTAGAPAPA